MIDNRSLDLTGGTVHIWIIRIEASQAAAARFAPMLSADEKERASKFRFEPFQHSFVVTRGALRCLAGAYSRARPASICFDYGPKGKPMLQQSGGRRIDFNLAHSGELAAVAFTESCEIGIDLEIAKPLPDAESVANRFFSREETAELIALSAGERIAAFYRCWTRKEAYLKATGDGLSVALDQFRVSLGAAEPARLMHLAQDHEAAKAWTLHELAVPEGYAGAIAYRDRERRLVYFPVVNAGELL